MSTSTESELVAVTITTRMGVVYSFPDVPAGMLDRALNKSGWVTQGTLILVNVSSACLTVPAQIIASIDAGGKRLYEGPPVH